MRKLLTTLVIIVFSCEDKGTVPDKIQPDFQVFVNRFYEEAELRDYHLSDELRNDLRVRYKELDDFCGYGYFHGYGNIGPLVNINNSDYCWSDRSFIERENLIFHEFGHALLNRSHFNKQFEGGYPASIMCTTNSENRCDNFQTYYSDEMRKYYLDELFYPKTPSPKWTNNNTLERQLLLDDMSDLRRWEIFNANDTSDYFVSLDSSQFETKSIVIGKKEFATTNKNYQGIIVQRFNLGNFENCSSIKARAKIYSEDLLYGNMSLGISLREEQNGEIKRFMFHERKGTDFTYFDSVNNQKGQELETEIFCIPEKTSIVSISFNLKLNNSAKVYIDQLEVELWTN